MGVFWFSKTYQWDGCPRKAKLKGFPDDLEHLLLKGEEGNENCVCNQVLMVDGEQYAHASVFWSYFIILGPRSFLSMRFDLHFLLPRDSGIWKWAHLMAKIWVVLGNDLALPHIPLMTHFIYEHKYLYFLLFFHIHLTVLSFTKMFLGYLFYLNFYSVSHQKAKEHIDLYKGRTGVLKNSFEGIFCLMKLMVFYQMTSLHYFVRWVQFFLFHGTSWLYLAMEQNYKHQQYWVYYKK